MQTNNASWTAGGTRMWPTALLSLLIIALMGLVAIARAQTTPEYGIRHKTPNRLLFTNGRIVVSPDRAYESGALFVVDGRVAAVGTDIRDTAGATVIDLDGATIYPGFIDAFTDYGMRPVKRVRPDRCSPPQYTRERVGGSAWNEAIHAEENSVDQFKPDDKAAGEWRGQGFATVLSVQQDGIVRGRSFVTTLGDGLPNDLILKAHHYQCASFDKGSSTQEYPGSLMGSIALLRQLFLDVDWYTKAQAAFARNTDQKKPEFNAALEALSVVGDETLIFETADELSLLRADRLADEFDIPLVQVGSGREYAALDLIQPTGSALILPVDYPDKPEVETVEDELDVSLAELRHWETAPSNAAMVAKRGITFALTTHRLKKKSQFLGNVRRAVERGLPEHQALASLTTVPASLCGVSELTGTLEPGKLANFFVCDGDVFKDDVTVYSTWIQGRKYDVDPKPVGVMRGEYALTLDETPITLSLKGTEAKLSGEYKLGDKGGKFSYLSRDDTKLSFSFSLDTLGFDGVLRFTGRLAGDSLSGWMDPPDGVQRAWRAVRTAPFTPEPDTAAPKPPEPLVSHLTFPNKAFVPEQLPPQQDVLVRNATIWTCDEQGVLENADLLVTDGKIAAVGKDLSAPGGVTEIDATGKCVTPGVIDAHSHLAISGDVNEGTSAVTAEVRIADVVNPYDIDIYRQLAGGVTTSHLLHGSANPIGGQVQIVKLRWGSSAEGLKFKGAPRHIKFALGENVKQSNWGERFQTRYPQTRQGAEAIIRDAFQAAREYERSWNDYNALSGSEHNRTVPPRRDLQLEALVDVLHSRMYVACHAYVASEMLMLIQLAEEYGFMVHSFEHGLEAYKIAAELAKAGVSVNTFPDWWAYKFEVYEAIPQAAGLLAEKGVLTSIKSDSEEMARHLNQEAGKSVKYTGMEPEKALDMVTINPARSLGVEDRVGSLTVGKDADFVIWSGPPLSIYSRPEQTWIEGHKYFDLETDHALRQQLKEEKNALVQKIIKTPGEKDFGKPKGRGDYHPGDSSGQEKGVL